MQSLSLDQTIDPAASAAPPVSASAARPVAAADAANTLAEVVAEGRIDPQGDLDCFTVELVAGQWYALDLVVGASVGVDRQANAYAHATAFVYDDANGNCVGGEQTVVWPDATTWSYPFQAQSTGPHTVRVNGYSADMAFGYDYTLRLAAADEPSYTASEVSMPEWPTVLDADAPWIEPEQWLEGDLAGVGASALDVDTYRIARHGDQRLMVYVEVGDGEPTARYQQLSLYATDHGSDGAWLTASSLSIGTGYYSWILQPDAAETSMLTLFNGTTGDNRTDALPYKLFVQALAADDFPWHSPGVLFDGQPQTVRVEAGDLDVLQIEAKAGEWWFVSASALQDAMAGLGVRSDAVGASEVLRGGYTADGGSTWQLVRVLADSQLDVQLWGYGSFAAGPHESNNSPTHSLLAQRIEPVLDEARPQVWAVGEALHGEVSAVMRHQTVRLELQAHQRYALDVQGEAIHIELLASSLPADGGNEPQLGFIDNVMRWMSQPDTEDGSARPNYFSVETGGWYELRLSSADTAEPLRLVPYELKLTPVPMDDHGDTTGTATLAQEWQTHLAHLQPSDVDVFAMDLQAGQRYAARLVGDGDWGSIWGELLNADGRGAGVYVWAGSSMVDQPFVVGTSGRYHWRLQAGTDATVTFAYLPVANDDHGDAGFNATHLQTPALPPPAPMTAALEPHASQFSIGLSGLAETSGMSVFDVSGP